MNKKSKKKLVIIFLFAISICFLSTGCTRTLIDKNNKAVKNEDTGQNLTENILCKPTNKKTLEVYKKNKVRVEKLPDCEKFKVTSGKYEGLWTSFLIKPLAYILILLGKTIKSYALSLIIVSLVIRLLLYPLTKKTAMQSELMKKAQPELQRIQNKYKDKQDQESMMKQSQEMMAVYQKYHMNPMSGCLFSFIQLPLLIAFFEAVQRTPAIFEDKFLGLQMGTTPMVGISSSIWYAYLILMLLIAGTTYFSFKMNMAGNTLDDSMKNMPIIMSITIIVMAMFMPSALGIYWVSSNVFTIFQNEMVKRSKKNEKRKI